MEEAQETKQEKTIGEKIKEVVFGKKSDEEPSESEVVETTVEAEPTAEEPKEDETQEGALSKEDMDAAIEKAKADAIEEYKKAEAEKDKKIQALEHEIMVNNSKNDAIKKLDEAGLPVKLADIINYSTKETAEASLDHIIKTYSECLENGIKEKLKGKTPEGLHSNATINDMQDKQNKMRKFMGIK